MFKSFFGIGVNDILKTAPDTYNYFASTVKLSEKRKAQIEETRAHLKVEENDPEAVRIVIEEMLAYKSNSFTLDDRYLQLEQILDAIEKAKTSKDPKNLINVCHKMTKDISAAPGAFRHSFLQRLLSIEFRTQVLEKNTLQAKL